MLSWVCKVYNIYKKKETTSNLKSKCLQLHQRFINSIKLNNAVSTHSAVAVDTLLERRRGSEAENDGSNKVFNFFNTLYFKFFILHLYHSPLLAPCRRHIKATHNLSCCNSKFHSNLNNISRVTFDLSLWFVIKHLHTSWALRVDKS